MPHLATNHKRVKDFRITLDRLGPKPRFRMHVPYDIHASKRLREPIPPGKPGRATENLERMIGGNPSSKVPCNRWPDCWHAANIRSQLYSSLD